MIRHKLRSNNCILKTPKNAEKFQVKVPEDHQHYLSKKLLGLISFNAEKVVKENGKENYFKIVPKTFRQTTKRKLRKTLNSGKLFTNFIQFQMQII